jgi:broad specificity phosphatase PhoE
MLALTDILFGRHGKSVANLATQIMKQGRPEEARRLLAGRHPDHVPLIDHGRNQARLLGDWLRNALGFHIDHYRTSPLPRTAETSGCLQLPDAEWIIEPHLVERSLGTVALPETQEGISEWRLHEQAQLDAPYTWVPPEGESIRDVAKRIRFMLSGLRHEEGTMLCITHREALWAIRTIFEHLSKDEFEAMYRSRAPEHRIWNCELFHYSRRDPDTNALSATFDWMRRVRVHESASVQDTGWKSIARKRLTNDELLALAAQRSSIPTPDMTP